MEGGYSQSENPVPLHEKVRFVILPPTTDLSLDIHTVMTYNVYNTIQKHAATESHGISLIGSGSSHLKLDSWIMSTAPLVLRAFTHFSISFL
jgi:hypothetical protein